MNYSKVAIRYAKALFELSQEKNIEELIKKDMLMIEGLFKDVPQLFLSISNPIIKSSVKRNIIKEVLKDKINDLTFKFLNLLIDNKREEHLENIIRDYFGIYRKSKGIKKTIITATKPLDTKTRESLIDFIKSHFDTHVELEEKVNEDLIGGIVLTVEDQQYDMSILDKLNKIEKKFKHISI